MKPSGSICQGKMKQLLAAEQDMMRDYLAAEQQQ
jgi:hypothetical protein